MILLPSFLGFASGFLLVRLGWGRSSRCVAQIATQSFLAIGFGAGILSLANFIVPGASVKGLATIDAVLFLVFAVVASIRRKPTTDGAGFRNSQQPRPLERVVIVAFMTALAAALYTAITRALAHPHGDGWDAFAIWNLHARFLFLGGRLWRDGFNALIAWSHPDYPLLLPGVIAHLWTFLKSDSVVVPSVIALLFSFCTVGLLCSALIQVRGELAGFLAGTVLLATPSFLEIGTWQYADVPLSFFILATIVLLSLSAKGTESAPARGMLALAGGAASCAAWTKNEGLLFFCAILAAWFLVGVRHRDPDKSMGSLWPFLAGALPLLFVVVYFKHWIAPANELFSESNAAPQKLLTLNRYWIAAKWFGKEFFTFGDWLWVPLTLAMVCFGLAWANKRESSPNLQLGVLRLSLLLTLAGYFMIYLITPYELEWHLRYSLNRLLLQLWPAAVYLFFLTFPVQTAEGESAPQISHK